MIVENGTDYLNNPGDSIFTIRMSEAPISLTYNFEWLTIFATKVGNYASYEYAYLERISDKSWITSVE